jgi:excinuclease UvrABC nuclease subunit
VDVNGERARAAGKHFATVKAMMAADVKEWRKVEGIGPKTAKRVVGVME